MDIFLNNSILMQKRYLSCLDLSTRLKLRCVNLSFRSTIDNYTNWHVSPNFILKMSPRLSKDIEFAKTFNPYGTGSSGKDWCILRVKFCVFKFDEIVRLIRLIQPELLFIEGKYYMY